MKKVIQKYDSKLFYKLNKANQEVKKAFPTSERKVHIEKNDQIFRHQKTLENLSVSYTANAQKKCTQKLDENGIVVIEGLIDRGLAIKAGEEFVQFIQEEQVFQKLDEQNSYENNQYIAQVDGAKIKGYGNLAKASKPVLTIRRKDRKAVDGGMFDAFGFNKGLINKFEALSACYQTISSEFIQSIILAQAGGDIAQQQLNIYYNQAVTNTRTWHVDSLFESYKVFVYLSDCEDLKHGPYGYVPESHSNRRNIKKNIKFNMKHEGIYTDQDMLISDTTGMPIMAKAGTIVISTQNGIHRGYPQGEDGRRIAMVDSYY